MAVETKPKHIISVPLKEIENCSVTLFDKICRVCFSCNEITRIFEQIYEHINLSEILETCFEIQVKQNDGLPQNICKWCISELIRIYTFKLHCQQSDAILRAALNKQKSNTTQNAKKQIDFEEELLDSSENIPRKVENADNNKVFKPDTGPNLNCIINIKKESTRTKCKMLKTNKSYSCKYCNILFDSHIKLIEHRKVAKHQALRNYICQICNKAFKANSRLQRHMRSHTKEKPFHCENCPKKFSLKNNLKRHNMIHTGERPFTCDECGKGFIQLMELTQHKRVHTGEKSPRKKYTVNKENQQAGAFLCNQCGKCLASLKALKIHINYHAGFKPYHCSVCNKKFSQPGHLNYHMFIHTGEKPFVCKICSMAFKQTAHLKTHMQTHTGERPYACSLCDRAFAQKGNFTVHMRTHTGETPYSCDVCGRGFYDSSNMKKHRKCHEEMKTDCSYIAEKNM